MISINDVPPEGHHFYWVEAVDEIAASRIDTSEGKRIKWNYNAHFNEGRTEGADLSVSF